MQSAEDTIHSSQDMYELLALWGKLQCTLKCISIQRKLYINIHKPKKKNKKKRSHLQLSEQENQNIWLRMYPEPEKWSQLKCIL